MSDRVSEPQEPPEPPEPPEPQGSAFEPPPDLRRIRRRAGQVFVVFAILCAIGAILDPSQLFRSYLLALVFWVSIALGCLAILMVHHLSMGGWSLMLRRTLEAAARTVWVLGLLFLPLLIGLPRLYAWARPEVVRVDAVLQHKAPYLNVPFFVARTALYFAVWTGLAYALSRMSRTQDRTYDPALARRMRTVGGVGLLAYGLTMTFAAFDWLMSLEPHWYSTIFGVYVVGGQAVSAMCFAILVSLYLARRPPMAGALRPRHFHDFGKMLLAFVMLWAYFGFSQFLIIWSGNLPEEVPWFKDRMTGGWRWVSLSLMLLHFVLPFLLLLSRDLKRSARRLAAVASFILLMRWVDLYWLIMPAFHPERLTLQWTDVAATIAVGGLWTWVFVRELAGRPLLPIHEPILEEALADE
jgi:hypothetical protein